MKLMLITLLVMNCSSTSLPDRFTQYRSRAVSRLEMHLEGHTDCALKPSLPVLQNVVLSFAPNSKSIKAWVIKREPIIFINSQLAWDDEEDAITTLIHESLHLTGKCGPDRAMPRVGDRMGVCRPFGVPLFTSPDITEAVKEHLIALRSTTH